MSKNSHLYLFATISFLAILLIIVLSPKAKVDMNSKYLTASTTNYFGQMLEY